MLLTLPYPPSTNRAWRNAKGRMVQSPEAKAWKLQAAWMARQQGATPADTAMAVAVTLHPRLTAKGRASKSRLDLDNILKPTLDALNGVAWVDDRQIESLSVKLGAPIPDGGLTVEAGPA